MEELATGWAPAQKFARRFAAGETLAEAVRVTRSLNAEGFRVTLDHLGEEVEGVASALDAARDYGTCIDVIDEESLDATISVKLTQLGLGLDMELAEANLRRVLARAEAKGNFVEVDMEGSAYTEPTLRIFHSVVADFENVGIAIQSYLRRSREDVAELARRDAPVRLVKGAYDEPRELAFQDKRKVDENFVALMKDLLDAGVPTAIATHDEEMVDATLDHASSNGGPGQALEFQMLYGINRTLQKKLLEAGHPVRIYVPFGSDWFPYMMRRIAERPANMRFVLRAVLGR
jgi:proline dehydrogenase